MYVSTSSASRARFATSSLSRFSSSFCEPPSLSASAGTASASQSSASFVNQRYRSLSFSSTLGSLQCSTPRWSYGANWRSPVSHCAQGRAATPVLERLERKIATIDRLPYSIRILLESAIRNCDNFQVTKDDVEKIIDWENASPKLVEIPFKPACVLLQDFTGVPAVVDLACMRDAMKNLGTDPQKINPLVPVDCH